MNYLRIWITLTLSLLMLFNPTSYATQHLSKYHHSHLKKLKHPIKAHATVKKSPRRPIKAYTRLMRPHRAYLINLRRTIKPKKIKPVAKPHPKTTPVNPLPAVLIPTHTTLSTWPQHLMVSLGGGAAFSSNLGSSQSFPILNPLTDEYFYYSAQGGAKSAGMLDIFLGKEWVISPIWATQLGMGYNQLFNASAQGTFIQGADVQSEDHYTYQYHLQTRQLLVENKWLYQHYPSFSPYFLVGIGLGLNSASDYKTNVPPFLTFTRQYQNTGVQTSFSYTLGLGVDKQFANNCRLGLGYRFADYGQAGLGAATIDGIPVSGTLSQSHVYTNGILAQITWVN